MQNSCIQYKRIIFLLQVIGFYIVKRSFNLLSLQFMNLFTMIALLVMTFFSDCMSSIDMSQFLCFHCCFISYLGQNYVCFCIDWRSTTLIKKNAIFHTVVRGRCFLGLEKREFRKFHCMCGFCFFMYTDILFSAT